MNEENMANKKTLVIGASTNPQRYSYLAMNRLAANGHEVLALGLRPGNVNGIEIQTKQVPLTDVDTVTLYVNPKNQEAYYDYILSLHPRRIIFNPGTENDTLYQLAEANNIKPIEACTLVMLSTKQY